MEKLPFLILFHTGPRVHLWFWPHLFVWVTLRHLFLPREDGVKVVAD